jgi:Dynein heavy chain, N-terminal region 1
VLWARHLLHRIEAPMLQFQAGDAAALAAATSSSATAGSTDAGVIAATTAACCILASPEAKKVIKAYNRVAQALVAFELTWLQAWEQSIDAARAGLAATLVIRDPVTGSLHANLDPELLTLIREARYTLLTSINNTNFVYAAILCVCIVCIARLARSRYFCENAYCQPSTCRTFCSSAATAVVLALHTECSTAL